jgi:hypothetical protein
MFPMLQATRRFTIKPSAEADAPRPADGLISNGRECHGMARSNRQVAGDLMTQYNVKQLRKLARDNGVVRSRGDSKRQTAWRIVKQAPDAARKATK